MPQHAVNVADDDALPGLSADVALVIGERKNTVVGGRRDDDGSDAGAGLESHTHSIGTWAGNLEPLKRWHVNGYRDNRVPILLDLRLSIDQHDTVPRVPGSVLDRQGIRCHFRVT